MAPRPKKAHKKNVEESQEDIITRIPEIMKEKILSYLPIGNAIRTSILSKAWRSTWTTIPDLVFRLEVESRDEHVRIVDSVLAQHQGPINKFEVSLEPDCSDDLDRWLLHLSRNGIKDLDIFMGRNNLPLSFFSCHALNRVHLARCLLELPQGFEGFEFLNTLELTNVDISSKDFEKLVSSSPELENLILDYYWEYYGPEPSSPEDLIINGPNLKKIDISSNFTRIKMNAPKLVVFGFIELTDPPIRNDNSNTNFTQALGCASQIEILRLGTNFLTYLSHAAGSVGKSGLEFHKMKEIQLWELNFDNCRIARIILYLLEKSPNLEVLDMKMNIPDRPNYEIINYWRSLNLRKYLFGRLKLVTINMFEFEVMDITLSFLKMILLCSPNLEKLHLLKGNLMHEESDEEGYLRKLRKLRKANENAQVVYEYEDL